MTKLSKQAAIVILTAALFLPIKAIAQNEHDQLRRSRVPLPSGERAGIELTGRIDATRPNKVDDNN